ncbi:MAG: DNA repair protein RecO [Acidobacteriota bacterium]
MPARRDEAFVLTRYPYQERDMIVVFLTRASGQVRALARRARGVRSPLAAAVEPLSLVRISYFDRPQRELARLDEAEPVRSSFGLASSPEAWAAAQVVAELALAFCPPGQRSEAMFRLVDRCLAALLVGHAPATVAAYATLWFVRLAGVFPDVENCAVGGESVGGGGWLDVREGVLVCGRHRPARDALRVTADAAAWLRAALRSPVEEIAQRPPDSARKALAALQRRFTDTPLASAKYLERLESER